MRFFVTSSTVAALIVFVDAAPSPDIFQDIGNGFNNFWNSLQNAGNQIGQGVQKIGDDIEKGVQKIGDDIGKAISGMAQDAQNAIDQVQTTVQQTATELSLAANGQTPGGPTSTVFADPNLVSLLTRDTVYASIAYCDAATLQQFSCSACTSNALVSGTQVLTVANNAQLETQGYVAIQPNQSLIIVSFRGSSNDKNWSTNFA